MQKFKKYIIVIKTILLTTGLFSASFSYALSFEQEAQQECSKVKQYANIGKKNYDQKQYSKALAQFQQQAAWTQFCNYHTDETGIKFSERDLAIAYNNVGLTYAKLNKPLWARAWYQLNINSESELKSTQFNLKQLPLPKTSSNLSGKYVRYAGFGEWNIITVQKHKTEYDISFDGLYMGLRSLIYGPNIGSFEITMPLTTNQTTYRNEECQIKLNFKSDTTSGHTIKVTQIDGASCGFGHNVSAEGIYYKVESK